jgi:hypothetical protein
MIPKASLCHIDGAVPAARFAPALSSTTTASPTFTAPDSAGWVEFTLTVTDNGGKTDTDTARIMVQASSSTNTPPTAVAGSNETSVAVG